MYTGVRFCAREFEDIFADGEGQPLSAQVRQQFRVVGLILNMMRLGGCSFTDLLTLECRNKYLYRGRTIDEALET